MPTLYEYIFLDLVYVCNKEGSGVKRFRNALVSRPLPFLRRSYISFHHLCGYDGLTNNGESPNDCKITIQKDTHQEEEYTEGPVRQNRSILLSVPESRLVNDGNVSKITDWFHEHRPLPRVKMNERIVLNAEFDASRGGFGADNIHFTTPQR